MRRQLRGQRVARTGTGSFVGAGALLVLCGAAAVSAAVLGDLGTGASGTLTITLNGFSAAPDPAALPLPGPPWNANVGTGTSLSFSGCVSGTLSSPGCLFSREGVLIQAVGTTFPISPFVQFESHPNLLYSLTAIGPGSASTSCGAALVGDSCSPFPGSPFILTRAQAGTTITIPLAGRTSDSGIPGLAAGNPWRGALTGTVAGQTPGQVQLFFCPSGTCVAADFTSGRSLAVTHSGGFLVPLVSGVDLAITKTDGVDSVQAGATTTYTITVMNDGTAAVTGATVTDTFPPSITSVSWTCTPSAGATCTSAGTGDIHDTVNLPSGGSAIYTALAAISPSATGSLTNTAVVTAPVGITDANLANNSATDTDLITIPVPLLSHAGMLVLALALMAGGLWALRRW